MKIRKGDTVKIISGNDKGKQARVLSVSPESERIVVDGIAMRKKHMRPRKQGQKGEIVQMPGAIAIARAMPVCPKCGKAARIGYRITAAGGKARVCKRCGAEI